MPPQDDEVLDGDLRIGRGAFHAVANPRLAPAREIRAQPSAAMLRVDAAVDRSLEIGAIHDIGVRRETAIRRKDEQLSEVQPLPVVQLLSAVMAQIAFLPPGMRRATCATACASSERCGPRAIAGWRRCLVGGCVYVLIP